jgi:hypothetical protein
MALGLEFVNRGDKREGALSGGKWGDITFTRYKIQ